MPQFIKVLDKDNLVVRDSSGTKHCWFVNPSDLKVNKLVLFSGDVMAAIPTESYYILAVKGNLVLVFNKTCFKLVKIINTIEQILSLADNGA